MNKVEKVMCGAGDQGIVGGGALALNGVTLSSKLQSNATQGSGRKMNNMKQLMMTVAIATAALTGFSLESSNIVG